MKVCVPTRTFRVLSLDLPVAILLLTAFGTVLCLGIGGVTPSTSAICALVAGGVAAAGARWGILQYLVPAPAAHHDVEATHRFNDLRRHVLGQGANRPSRRENQG